VLISCKVALKRWPFYVAAKYKLYLIQPINSYLHTGPCLKTLKNYLDYFLACVEKIQPCQSKRRDKTENINILFFVLRSIHFPSKVLTHSSNNSNPMDKRSSPYKCPVGRYSKLYYKVFMSEKKCSKHEWHSHCLFFKPRSIALVTH
jgi:hypothetical protein